MADPTTHQLLELVERARRRGARQAEVLQRREEGVNLRYARGKLVSSEAVSADRLQVRVWTADGGGRATGDTADADAVISAAFAALRPVDELDGPAAKLQALGSGLAIEDRRWAALEEEDRLEVLSDADRAARLADRRLTVEPIGYEDRAIFRGFASTTGQVGTERSTLFSAWAAGTLAADAGPPLPLRAELQSRSFSSLASLPFGVELARRAEALLAPRVALEPGPVRVLLGSRCAARLLDQLARLCVPWAADRSFLRGAALDPKLHLVDDPIHPGGLRSRLFDDRGVPPIPLTLLKEGRLNARYLDPIGAARAEVRPSGHVWGDDLAPSNLLFRHGTRSVHVILGELGGRTFAPDDLPDWSGLDPATGRLETVVHGTVFEGARPVGAALRVRLVADLAKVLDDLVEISCETDRIGHVDAPAMVVDGFTVAG